MPHFHQLIFFLHEIIIKGEKILEKEFRWKFFLELRQIIGEKMSDVNDSPYRNTDFDFSI